MIEPACKGCFDWTTTDAWRDEAQADASHDLRVAGLRAGVGERRPPVRYPPLNYQDWYDFVFATVSRYRDDIHLWGVWNEPNLDQYLQGADPRVYRSLRDHRARGDSRGEPARASCSGPTSAGTASRMAGSPRR